MVKPSGEHTSLVPGTKVTTWISISRKVDRARQRFTLTDSTPPFGDSGSEGKLVRMAIFRISCLGRKSRV